MIGDGRQTSDPEHPVTDRVLGRYELTRPVGEGGTSTVWAAIDRDTGDPAAVKVLSGGAALGLRHHEAFRYEVRAVAVLDHPGVVTILDQGVVPEVPPDPRLAPGAPWVAMELLTGGTLADRVGAMAWPELVPVLHTLLSALGHAHARGVVHRDVKPGNVLLDADQRVRLADFGIAAVLDERPATGVRSGTPGFMAPEQRSGTSRDLGPWTDLYGLGRLALAVLDPARPRPAAADAWMMRLVAEEPAARFRRCADAAAALDAVVAGAPSPALPPPPPPDWRIPEVASSAASARRNRRWDIHAVPFVGRDDARDRLWAELRAVHGSGDARVVVITGTTGIGKSRLAEWLCQRAHEVGAAEVGLATHAPIPSPEHGVRAMFCRLFAVRRLDGQALADALAARLDALGASDPADRRIALRVAAGLPTEATERHAVLHRLVCALGRERPVVLRLEDAQFGADALGLALAVARRPAGCRALVLVTARDEGFADRPVERDQLVALRGLPACRAVAVGTLGPADDEALVALGPRLDPEVAKAVLAHGGGHPAYAGPLVRAWTDAGRLVPGPTGLRRTDDGPLPADALAVWDERLAWFLAGRPAEDAVALELAAILGTRVDDREWAALCAARGVPPAPHLPDLLVDHALGFCHPGHGGWSFAHLMLREAAERRAMAVGRAQGHHLAAARVVSGSPPLDAERVALHLAAAGAPIEAARALLDAAEAAIEPDGPEVARHLVALARQWAVSGGVAASDPWWTAEAVVRARTDRAGARGVGSPVDDATGDVPPSPAWVELASERIIVRLGVDDLAGASSIVRASHAHAVAVGGPAEARWQAARAELCARTEALAEAHDALCRAITQVDDLALQAQLATELAAVAVRAGRLQEARRWLLRAEPGVRARRPALARWNEVRGALAEVNLERSEAAAARALAARLLRAAGRDDADVDRIGGPISARIPDQVAIWR